MNSCLRAVGDPELPPGERPSVARAVRSGLERERVAAARRLRKGKGAQHLRGEAGKEPGFLLLARPPAHRVVHQRVVHVNVDRGRCVDPRQLLDRKRRHEDAARRPAVLLGDLDPHEPQLEELRDQLREESPRLVHLRDMGGDFRLGEFTDGRAEQLLFFREEGQGWRSGCNGHRKEGVTVGE